MQARNFFGIPWFHRCFMLPQVPLADLRFHRLHCEGRREVANAKCCSHRISLALQGRHGVSLSNWALTDLDDEEPLLNRNARC